MQVKVAGTQIMRPGTDGWKCTRLSHTRALMGSCTAKDAETGRGYWPKRNKDLYFDYFVCLPLHSATSYILDITCVASGLCGCSTHSIPPHFIFVCYFCWQYVFSIILYHCIVPFFYWHYRIFGLVLLHYDIGV